MRNFGWFFISWMAVGYVTIDFNIVLAVNGPSNRTHFATLFLVLLALPVDLHASVDGLVAAELITVVNQALGSTSRINVNGPFRIT